MPLAEVLMAVLVGLWVLRSTHRGRLDLGPVGRVKTRSRQLTPCYDESRVL
jgi:hypothetical protein